MIQLNLLPDVKLDYLKAQHARRLVFSVSILVAVAAVVILVLLLLVDIAQKKHLSDLDRNIKSESATLQNKPDISKILTVQNQLESLTNLHSQKPAASRLFSTYLDQLTPANVSISDLSVDFTKQTMTITGNSDSLASVNKYVDTLKFTTYKADQGSGGKAFSDVVLSSFSINTSASNPGQQASYTVDLSYDPNIFDITQNAKLTVPSITTTRSEIAQPGDLFKSSPASTPSGTSIGGQ